jgi:hypothetical protein
LLVPSQPWEAIGIDFVGPLPQSKDRDATYDSITVVIDLLTGWFTLFPAKQMTQLVKWLSLSSWRFTNSMEFLELLSVIRIPYSPVSSGNIYMN